jgi:hypothetical protein
MKGGGRARNDDTQALRGRNITIHVCGIYSAASDHLAFHQMEAHNTHLDVPRPRSFEMLKKEVGMTRAGNRLDASCMPPWYDGDREEWLGMWHDGSLRYRLQFALSWGLPLAASKKVRNDVSAALHFKPPFASGMALLGWQCFLEAYGMKAYGGLDEVVGVIDEPARFEGTRPERNG